ncbi:MAG: hypothetical protein MZV64_30165 [Ignavibacteriales bacterium]|nr:hypothetical protein [Ignavibacteriales bacterium]
MSAAHASPRHARPRHASAGCARARWRRRAARCRGAGSAPRRSRCPRQRARTPSSAGAGHRADHGVGVGLEGEHHVVRGDGPAIVPARSRTEREAPRQRIHPLPSLGQRRPEARGVDGGATGTIVARSLVDAVADVATDRLLHQRRQDGGRLAHRGHLHRGARGAGGPARSSEQPATRSMSIGVDRANVARMQAHAGVPGMFRCRRLGTMRPLRRPRGAEVTINQ